MPTYVCSLAAGSVDDRQKPGIAEAITRGPNEETGVPRDFVQGGSRASGQSRIRGDIRAGRTEMQRHAMMLRIMREVAQITGVKEESIWVYLCNLAPTDMVE